MMRILWVDDDPVFLKLVSSALKEEMDTVVEAVQSGKEALKCMRENPADLLFTDLKMPEMSGMDLLAETKKHFPSTEVIVVTGQASINDAVTAMKYGAFDFLVKPLSPDLVKEKITVLRSVLSCRMEMEEFRHAKEMIESGAKQNISNLEITLDCCMRRLESIVKIINSDVDDAHKIEKISSVISTGKKLDQT